MKQGYRSLTMNLTKAVEKLGVTMIRTPKPPKIKWGVNRGKNPPGAPWGETRDNDVHLKLEVKRKAQGSAARK